VPVCFTDVSWTDQESRLQCMQLLTLAILIIALP
jgi:hypothetical protein